MVESFGIDTQATHLDLIQWADFQTWNSGLVPFFAGRNFLGGQFIWAPAEATSAIRAPQPEDFSKIALLTSLIAPIQGVSAIRQQVTGDLGTLYGRIDAEALCARLSAAMTTKELTLKESNRINVYLQVDPNAPFSADYWAGWADTVFNAPLTEKLAGGAQYTNQPFFGCIMCAFHLDGAVLRIDPHVPVTLQTAAAQHPELKTQCYGFWADAADLDPALQHPNPVIDWTRFAPAPAPIWLWRFARRLINAAGQPVFAAPPLFATSAVNSAGAPPHFGWEYMLDTWAWQPSNADLRLGILTDWKDGLTAAQITRITQTPLPEFQDLQPHYTFATGPVVSIGRYLKPTVVDTVTHHAGHFIMTRAEAERLSTANFEIFTVWEDINVLAHSQALNIGYFDPAIHTGTEDGQKAFAYCGGTLRQPPYSAVYFAVDFDPEDTSVLGGVSVATAKDHILQYFHLVKAQRDAYALANPGRYYLIGVYGKGAPMEWLYRDPVGAVDMYWQSASTGGSNGLPNRPWCHANRWQVASDVRLNTAWPVVRGADPDADWGDGGTWQLNRPLVRQLEQLEDAAARAFLHQLVPWFPLLNDL